MFSVSTRLASGEWRFVDPAAADYPDCFSMPVKVSASGCLGLATSDNEYESTDEATGP